MSDIIYTPPSSSGTTINPTNKFIPVRSNATTFIDSCLKQQTTTMLVTSFSGNDNGLKVDGGANSYFLGNYAIGTTSYINVATGGFSYIYGGNVLGIDCNFGANQYRLGRFTGGNTTFLSINDTAQTLSTFGQATNNGLFFNYSVRQYTFGQINSANRTFIFVNDTSQTILTNNNGLVNGLRFDYGGLRTYLFGQITGSNRNNLLIDDANNVINTSRNGTKTGISLDTNLNVIGSLTVGNQTAIGTNDSSQSFVFNGTGITTATAGGNAGVHIKILVNGTPYKIQLLNP
jgi:hypothetical protein